MEPKPKTVLVVEDEAHDRLLIQGILAAEDLNLIMVEDGEAALASVAERLPDMVIVDLMLPGGIDGFELTRRLKSDPRTHRIPVMIVTALQDRESRLQALALGVEEFICKPVDRAELSVRVKNLLRLKEYQDFLAEHNRMLEEQVSERTEKLRQLFEQTIAAVALTLEKRDPYAAGHQQRVAELAAAIAVKMGVPQQQVEGIRFGALLHNIGMVAVPSEILNRPGKLDKLQYALIKMHPQIGFDIVKDIPFPWPIAQMVLQHHERLDGSGYPLGLKGEQISLEARIVGVADVWAAVLAYRPYRAGQGRDEALRILTQGRGIQFDPVVVDACLRVVSQPAMQAPADR